MQPSWRSEYIVLALLGEQPMHGYELHQRVAGDEALRAIWRIERSQLYFLLRKLERAELVVEVAAERAAGPPRLIYEPTLAGRRALEEWLCTPEMQPHDLRAAFLAKLYFVLRYRPESAPELLAAQREVLHERANLQRERSTGENFVALVHQLRLGQVEAALSWIEDLQQRLRNGALLVDDGARTAQWPPEAL